MKRLSLLGIGWLAASFLIGTPKAEAHGDAGSSSADTGHSDTSTHGGTSNSGGHSGHEGETSHSHTEHGRFGDDRGSPFAPGSGMQHGGGHTPYWHDSRHWEMFNFNPILGTTFHASESSGVGGRFHFHSGGRQTERSRGDSTFASRGWDPRRDAIFHGHHYHRYGGAWVLINDDYDPSEDFFFPPVPYEFAGGSDFPEDPPSRDDGGQDLIGIAVQTKLARRGYYHGRIDGIMGPATREAISAYQRDNGLRVTGYINTDLVEALKL